MATPGRNPAAIASGLILLAGVLVFFQARQDLPSFTASGGAGVASPPSLRPETTAPATPALGAATPTLPAQALAAEATTPLPGLPLPDLPSGDYDINLTEEQVGALVEQRYAALFPRLRLTPGDLARFRTLLVERQHAVIDAANSAILVGVNPVRDLATIRGIVETAQAEAETTLRNEMGEAVFAAWREYDRTLAARSFAAGERNTP